MTITASSVSRYLGARGWHRSEWNPSAQVRGWGHQSTGFRCEESSDFNYKPSVRVTWVPGEGYRRHSVADLREMVRDKIDALVVVLSEKYNVQREEPDSTFGGDPYLVVTPRAEEE